MASGAVIPPAAIANMAVMIKEARPGVDAVLERRVTCIPLYKVLLHNDDVNTMEHVVAALEKVFRFDRAQCERIMIEAHANRVALCAVEPLEPAEFHRDQLISFSLIATIEPE